MGELNTLLTVADVARLFGLKEKTIYRWVASRRIEVIRVGRRLRFDQGDIMRWIAARKESA